MATTTKKDFDEVYLTNLIAKGDLQSALEALKEALPDNKDVNNLMGQYFEERKNNSLSLTSTQNHNAEINRIRDATLSIIEEHKQTLVPPKLSFFSPFYCIIGHIPAYMEERTANKCYLRIAPESLREHILKELKRKKAKSKDIEEKELIFDEKPETVTSDLVEINTTTPSLWGNDKHFDIVKVQKPQQKFSSGSIAEWDYFVTPLSTGQRQLVLKIKADKSPERILDRHVDVVGNGSYNYGHTLANIKAWSDLPRLRFPNNRFIIFLLPLLIYIYAFATPLSITIGAITTGVIIGKANNKKIVVVHPPDLKVSDIVITIDSLQPDSFKILKKGAFEIQKAYYDVVGNSIKRDSTSPTGLDSYNKVVIGWKQNGETIRKVFKLGLLDDTIRLQEYKPPPPPDCKNCPTFEIICPLDAAYLKPPVFSIDDKPVYNVVKIANQVYKLTVKDTFGKTRIVKAVFEDKQCIAPITLDKSKTQVAFKCEPVIGLIPTKIVDIQTLPNKDEDKQLIVKDTYNDSIVHNLAYLKGENMRVELLLGAKYLVEVRSKSCASSKQAFTIVFEMDTLVVPTSCPLKESTVIIYSKHAFKNPIVLIDKRTYKPTQITEGGKKMAFGYPTGQDNTPHTITIADKEQKCTRTMPLNKKINIVRLDCTPITHPETVEVTFVLGENLQDYAEYIQVYLDTKLRGKDEYRVSDKYIIMNVFGNKDKNNDGKYEPRTLRIDLALPNKKPLYLCGYTGNLQKAMTLNCNNWAFKIY
jgi:hypothetical protein